MKNNLKWILLAIVVIVSLSFTSSEVGNIFEVKPAKSKSMVMIEGDGYNELGKKSVYEMYSKGYRVTHISGTSGGSSNYRNRTVIIIMEKY